MRNLKKVISSVAALAIVASSASAFAVTFPDVEESASYNEAVKILSGLKIVEGDDNGLFNPDKTVTRAEFTKMAVGALGEMASAEAQSTSKFDDAANTSVHWGAGYIAQGVADGFIDGYDDHRFGPDDTVTYAQACKMLVAAIGYTTYAEAAGGYPAGYTAQASSLGISKGVSAQNDAALTRGQVAILIANAMDVPLNVIDGWKTESNLTGTYQAPEFKKLDGKEGRDFESLLTDRHDAYKVKGRVTVNYQGSSSSLKKDEVKYDVEVADNFDGEMNIKNANKNWMLDQIFKVGDTDAANMLFAYTEAVVKKDVDADEFTIISITNYGNSKTVEFEADDLADDAENIGTNYIDGKSTPKLPVYKSATTSSTTKYDLATDPAAVMYVNGVKAGTADDEMINEYILNNDTGKVTLVDKTEVGSTSTDGKYDYIMVSYYVDAVVDYTQSTDSVSRVYFKAQPSGYQNRMEWDPDDEDVDVTFTKDGNKIAFTDLQENDVLSIQYDIINGKELKDRDYYNVLVASNAVEGNVTSKDEEDQTITIGGNEYDLVEGMTSTGDYELGTSYKVYVDAFGYVAYFDEGNSEKNYGVIVAMYKGNGDDYYTVRMITSDAKVVTYECKDEAEESKFYTYATTGTATTGTTPSTFSKTTAGVRDRIKSGETVCTYKLTSGKIKFDKAMDAVGGTELTYKANSTKLGGYTLKDSVTKIVDMDDYMKDSNAGNTVATLSVSSFEDDADYEAYLFDKNTNGDYRFAIVLNGTSSIRPETQIAVVKAVNGQKDSDSTTCNAYTVGRGGNEIELLVEDSADSLSEGAIVAYTIGSEGYVEDGDLYVLYNPAGDYKALLANVTGNDDFGAGLQNVQKVTASGKNNGKYEIAYNGKTSTAKDVFAYLGVVYRKSASSFDLFTDKTNGATSINDTTDFSIAGANVYTFDYNERVNKGVRLSVGNSGTQNTSIFNQAYSDENGNVTADSLKDKNYVTWDQSVLDANSITPQLAFVKEVDNDVTDVVFFVAP